MSVQVSTRIDEVTKQQFDKICESIGISPSNALSMFIKGVINHNGIPFYAVAHPVRTYKASTGSTADTALRPPFQYDSMNGEVWMSDDFDAPLEDFSEYMP